MVFMNDGCSMNWKLFSIKTHYRHSWADAKPSIVASDSFKILYLQKKAKERPDLCY